MWFYTLLNVVITILVVIAVLYLAFRFYVVRQGDEHIQMVTKRRSAFQLEDISFDKVTLVCDIPFTNRGKQNGLSWICTHVICYHKNNSIMYM